MAIIVRVEPPIPNTFFFKSPAQLFRKLHWELAHLRQHLEPNSKPFGPQDVGFAAFNFAVTAWHLTDWSYRSMNDEDWRNEVYADLSLDDVARFKALNDAERQRAFVRALASKYSELRICHDLANGDKHRGLSQPKCAQLSASVRGQWRDDFGGHIRSYQLIILDGEKELDGLQFFKGVTRLWEELLASWGFIEGRYFDSRGNEDEF